MAELKRELAVALFAQGRLSLGRAMEVDRISFQQFFGDRGIATVYGGVADRLGEEADLLREGLLGWGNRGFEWIADPVIGRVGRVCREGGAGAGIRGRGRGGRVLVL